MSARVLKVINVITRKLKPGQLEKARPADALNPLAHTARICARVSRRLHNLHHGLDHLGQARRIIGEERNRQLGKLGALRALLTLPPTQNGQTVVVRIIHRHGGAYGVAIATIHTLLFPPRRPISCVHSRRTNRSGGAGSDQRRHLAHSGQRGLNLRGKAMNARMAMSEQCTAPHILRQQATAIPQFCRKVWCVKRSVESIHHAT